MERIWIYTISKLLSEEQQLALENRCWDFANTWTSHEVSLDAAIELYKNRLLIFKVNEEDYNASGCSIDKQIKLIKELEKEFSIELLNRLLVAYERNGKLFVVNQSEISNLLANKIINENTVVYDNTITHYSQIETEWKKQLKDTYLSKYLISNNSNS